MKHIKMFEAFEEGDSLQLKFKDEFELKVYQNEEKNKSKSEKFKKDDVIDVDLIEDREDAYYVQFGDGDVSYVPKEAVEVL